LQGLKGVEKLEFTDNSAIVTFNTRREAELVVALMLVYRLSLASFNLSLTAIYLSAICGFKNMLAVA